MTTHVVVTLLHGYRLYLIILIGQFVITHHKVLVGHFLPSFYKFEDLIYNKKIFSTQTVTLLGLGAHKN